MDNLIFSGNNVPIDVVARVMKKREQFVRLAIQERLVPFGIAIKKNGQEQYDYYVSPKLFYEYTGYIYNETSDRSA